MANMTDRILVVISASASGAVQELDKVSKSAKDADTHADKLSKTMKAGLAAGAAALVGTGLVSFLQNYVSAFADAAKSAGDLAAPGTASVTVRLSPSASATAIVLWPVKASAVSSSTVCVPAGTVLTALPLAISATSLPGPTPSVASYV